MSIFMAPWAHRIGCVIDDTLQHKQHKVCVKTAINARLK